MQFSRLLPNITKTHNGSKTYTLQWVGMEDVAVPITLDIGDRQKQTIPAKANVYISLDDKTVKGIHMSRLHAILNELQAKVCDKDGLDLLLEKMVTSHAGTSQSARISLAFDLLLPKESLLSNETGFQSYCIEINGRLLNGRYDYGIKITVPYSSTCPCSAALADQLFSNAIENRFIEPRIDKQELISWLHSTKVATLTCPIKLYHCLS